MIQRIQTLYLFVVALCAGLLPLFVTLWKDHEGTIVMPKDNMYIFGAFALIAILAVISIFLFNNRKNQFVLNRLNIILNVLLLGFFVYRSLNLSGEGLLSEKGIGMFLPVISIVFLVLANKAIKKDEDLVKSVDRLR